MQHKRYWKSCLGIELFKANYYAKWCLYKFLGITLPKLRDQREYWKDRGQVYMEEIMSSGYLEREVFFQNMLIDTLRGLDFESFFEAGCGFGWNIRRVKEEFPETRVGGVDFSITQLHNAQTYLNDFSIHVINSDNCDLPLKTDSFDIGFSLGVFMNIHPDRIRQALSEMMRVCRKYIIHIEYDDNHTTPELREKRDIKTNIVSHDYTLLYRELGADIVGFLTYMDFGPAYYDHAQGIKSNLSRWEGFEGPEKYMMIILKV